VSRPERKTRSEKDKLDIGMERFRLEVGNVHGVKPGNIVGAIANEAEIESEYIGRIEIFDDYSTVDLPEGMPKELLKHLKTVWVSGQRLQISRLNPPGKSSPPKAGKRKPAKDRSDPSLPKERLASDTKSGARPPAKLGISRLPVK
jgi:ATP-dependent RNA helicase DeaD